MTSEPASLPKYASKLQLTQRPPADTSRLEAPDRRDGRVYAFDDWLKLSVEIALTTGRPLLVRGDPGSGKSSLAAFLARNLGWRYYEQTCTSETRVRDLLWRWDAVRRLSDAQVDGLRANHEYVEPGALWWAFNRESARRRGAREGAGVTPAEEPEAELNASRSAAHAIVLIDEIDKADPDVPNGLLEPLASMRFEVHETATAVRPPDALDGPAGLPDTAQHLIVITTNEERELPPAFIRRCVVHELRHPSEQRLIEIARLHLVGPESRLDAGTLSLCTGLARRLVALRNDPTRRDRRKPSTAEYLDAVRACLALAIQPSLESETWRAVEAATWRKEISRLDQDDWHS